MKKTYYLIALLFFGLGFTACEIEERIDPNNPSLDILENPGETELNALVYGSIAGMRIGYQDYITATGTVARELYFFNADPRNTSDLLGKDGAQLDNNTFYLIAPYNGRYSVVKNTNILLDALSRAESISEAEKNGYEAFAKTLKAHQLLLVLNMLGENGIRVDVADPENPGPFLSYEESLQAIQSLLSEAAGILKDEEVAFAFELPGFGGPSDPIGQFNGPEGFYKFNRALAARVAAYQENWQLVLDNLDKSFLELNGDLSIGPEMVFSTSSGDMFNPVYKSPANSDDQIFAHPSFVNESAEEDLRVENKIVVRDEPTTKDKLTSRYSTGLYASSTAPIDIIRNEELILLYAEAKIQLGGAENFEDAIEALNLIRTTYELDPYNGPSTKEALIDEMLTQRRYSFWSEGHRFVDLRRYGLLNEDYLPIDREGDQVFTEFPRPISEG